MAPSARHCLPVREHSSMPAALTIVSLSMFISIECRSIRSGTWPNQIKR